MTELVKHITHTVEGYEVKNLTWKPLENIIVGLVKDPVLGKPALRDGWVMMGWRRNGTILTKFGGTRKDLDLSI